MNQKLITPVLMWAIVFVGAVAAFVALPTARLFPRSYVTDILLALAILYWVYFFSSALRVNRNAVQSVARVQRIVTTGAYAFVRHPIYSSDIILAWAAAFSFPSIAMLVAVVWLTLTLRYWMSLEEQGLQKKFGRQYAEYRKNVPMFVPKIWKV